MIIVNPFVYVDTSVAKCVINVSDAKFCGSGISNVRIRDDSLDAQKRKGLRSMHTRDATSFRKPGKEGLVFRV